MIILTVQKYKGDGSLMYQLRFDLESQQIIEELIEPSSEGSSKDRGEINEVKESINSTTT